MKNSLKVLAGLVLAGLLLWWVLRGTDARTFWQLLGDVSVPGLLAATLAVFGANLFRVWRWRALLEPVVPDLPFRSLFVSLVLGYAVSFAVPGRLGEVLRPALLSGRERIPLGPSLGSVLTERVMDMLTILVLFAAGTLLVPLEGEVARHTALIRGSSIALTLVIGIPFAVLVVLGHTRGALDRRLTGRRGAAAWLARSILALSRGTDALVRPRLLVRIVLESLLVWITVALGTWIGVLACGARISLPGMLVIQPLLVLGIALPTPGGTGGYHAAMTLGLSQLLGVDQQLAVTTSFMLHLIAVVPVILVGGAILLIDRGLVQDLRRASRQVTTLGSGEPPTGGGATPS